MILTGLIAVFIPGFYYPEGGEGLFKLPHKGPGCGILGPEGIFKIDPDLVYLVRRNLPKSVKGLSVHIYLVAEKGGF